MMTESDVSATAPADRRGAQAPNGFKSAGDQTQSGFAGFELVAPVPIYWVPSIAIYNDDCLRVLRSLPDASVHSVVTDPPYAIATKTKGHVSEPLVGAELQTDESRSIREDLLMRAPMLGMQSQNWHDRATHSRGYADNDPEAFAEWCTLWTSECLRVLKPGGHILAFGGTRTWHRLASAIEDVGFEIRDSLAWLYGSGFPKSMNVGRAIESSRSLSEDARTLAPQWEGWGTTLKPAFEPIVMARKPLDGTVAENVVHHGTGALAIDANRLPQPHQSATASRRWPTNVYLAADQAAYLDTKAGEAVSRFFWIAKPDQGERPSVAGVTHPTVKPLGLMQELVRLVTPPGGCVLDPFAGSGTTVEACLLEGFDAIGVERQADYIPLIRQRIDRRTDTVKAVKSLEGDASLFALFDASQ